MYFTQQTLNTMCWSVTLIFTRSVKRSAVVFWGILSDSLKCYGVTFTIAPSKSSNSKKNVTPLDLNPQNITPQDTDEYVCLCVCVYVCLSVNVLSSVIFSCTSAALYVTMSVCKKVGLSVGQSVCRSVCQCLKLVSNHSK